MKNVIGVVDTSCENGNSKSKRDIMSKMMLYDDDGVFMMKTYLFNFDPLKPHFFIVKLLFTGVYIIFLISAQKHRLWVLVMAT